MEKGIHELKAEFVHLYAWEREKINSFEITVIIFRHIRNVNLLFKKNFKSAELLTKTSFFLYFRDRPKNDEGNKEDVESICPRVTKHIYVQGRFSLFDTNVLTGSMISLFAAAPAPKVRRERNLMGISVRNGLRFFLLFGKKYYFMQKLSFLINNLFGNVFQTSGVIGLKRYCMRNCDTKKVFQLLEKSIF